MTADDILKIEDRATVKVSIPEWNTTLTIRAFSGAERDSWEYELQQAQKAGKKVDNFRAKLAALIVVNDDGSKMFSNEQIEALGSKSAKALDRIFDAFIKLNKLSNDEVNDYEKNS
jgi:hypothetical protein